MSDFATKLPKMGTCRGKDCSAQIRFVPVAHKTTTLVVNARSNRKGNVWVRDTPSGPVAQVLTKDATSGFVSAGIPLYLSHHATCPNAGEFGGKRRAA